MRTGVLVGQGKSYCHKKFFTDLQVLLVTFLRVTIFESRLESCCSILLASVYRVLTLGRREGRTSVENVDI